MLLLFLTMLSFLQPSTVQDPSMELKKWSQSISSSLDAYCLKARKVNGTVSNYQLVGTNKKLTLKTILKADQNKYLILEYNGNDQFTAGELYRQSGDTQQVVIFSYSKASKGPRMQKEYYAKVGEKFVEDEYENQNYNNRVYAYDSSTTYALRPMPQVKLTLADLLEYPAFKVTSFEIRQGENGKIAKISFLVDQEVNAKQSSDKQLADLKSGWFELRPDQFWTMHQAEYTMGRGQTRKWKVDFVYDNRKNAIPLLKEIKMKTVDQLDNKELIPISRSIEFDFHIVDGILTEDQFTLPEFKLPARSIEDGLKEKEDRKRRELADAIIPPSTSEGFPLAKKGLEVNPWVWFYGGPVVFLIVLFLVFRMTSKNKIIH